MKKKTVVYTLTALYALVLTLLSYLLQTYQFTALEEVHIFLFDSDYVGEVIAQPGGCALLLSSMFSQMFICRFAGPLIAGIIYAMILFPLSSIAVRRGVPDFIAALAVLPCFCLMLCLENSAYMFQGTGAMLLDVLAMMAFMRVSRHKSLGFGLTFGVILNAAMYWATGPCAFALSLCCMITSVGAQKSGRLKMMCLSLSYPATCAIVACLYYVTGHIDTLNQAFTPAMYYDMGSTYFMYLYAMCSLVIYILIVAITPAETTPAKPLRSILVSLALFAVLTGLALRFFCIVHSASNYDNQKQRFYARHGMWDQILAMPYDGTQTPFTSYRFLALAEKGRLAQEVGNFRPFISYIFENKPKVKKRDQQIYSDIWYVCDYMPAARKAAFDTDIVTPGRFNPYETLKLAEINIVYGDYAVAEKLITRLEKTWFYRKKGNDLRQYLYDDEKVSGDPILGPKRRAIAPNNEYLSPKGIQRDLKYVVDHNPRQHTAEQFYKTFLILTNQHEDN